MKTKEPKKIEVQKIDIKIGDKTISLKPEQAKELKKILNDMFEEKTVVHEHRYWWNWPYTYSPPSYPNWTIWCGGTSASSSSGYVSSNCTNAGTVTLALAS